MLAEVLHNLALRMIQESLESMNEKIKKNWKKVTALGGESHVTKQLVTSLGTVTFKKTLFKNK